MDAAQPLTSSTSPIPSFGHGPPKESRPPPKVIQQQPHQPHLPLLPSSKCLYSPSTLDTPSSTTSSTSSSPVSSASLSTPVGMENYVVKIASTTFDTPLHDN